MSQMCLDDYVPLRRLAMKHDLICCGCGQVVLENEAVTFMDPVYADDGRLASGIRRDCHPGCVNRDVEAVAAVNQDAGIKRLLRDADITIVSLKTEVERLRDENESLQKILSEILNTFMDQPSAYYYQDLVQKCQQILVEAKAKI